MHNVPMVNAVPAANIHTPLRPRRTLASSLWGGRSVEPSDLAWLLSLMLVGVVVVVA